MKHRLIFISPIVFSSLLLAGCGHVAQPVATSHPPSHSGSPTSLSSLATSPASPSVSQNLPSSLPASTQLTNSPSPNYSPGSNVPTVVNTPPFSGSNVVRAISPQALSALPINYPIADLHETYNPNQWETRVSWTGQLAGHHFLLSFYLNPQNQEILVADQYDHHVVNAFSPTYSMIEIRNFTGSFVVCEYAPAGWFALNLQTGQLIQGQPAARMDGFYPHITGPNYILGSPSHYPIVQIPF